MIRKHGYLQLLACACNSAHENVLTGALFKIMFLSENVSLLFAYEKSMQSIVIACRLL